MFLIIKDHYKTFHDAQKNRNESHFIRLLFQVIFSILSCFIFSDLSDNLISVSITSLSILAGFSFSAMFPIASDVRADLPDEAYTEDGDDLDRLTHLSSFFRANVSYFIPLTLFCILVLLLQMIHLEMPPFLIEIAQALVRRFPGFIGFLTAASHIFSRLILGFSVFLFFEAIYTFYRMCFNVLFFLRIREEYLKGHSKHNA